MKIEQLIPRAIPSVERVLDEAVSATRVNRLTPARARRLAATVDPSTVVIATSADHGAIDVLRAAHQSYHVESTGETYLAPQIADNSADRVSGLRATPANTPRITNPFARRASRVARFLLLHSRETFSVNDLARMVSIDKSVASRTVAALAAEGLVDVLRNPDDERAKVVVLTEPRRLLEEWGRVLRRRRLASQRFDIGTRNVKETLRAISDARDEATPWAISGLAGASFVRRVVEPADVLLLTSSVGTRSWQERLFAEPSSSDRGLLRMTAVPDDFIFTFAKPTHGLVIADPVQLWLDTSNAGERALEARSAITRLMNW